MKVASAGAAAVGFGLLSVLVRGGHSGSGASATPAGSLGVSSRISQEAAQSGSFFGSGSVGSGSSSSPAPQASTHTS